MRNGTPNPTRSLAKVYGNFLRSSVGSTVAGLAVTLVLVPLMFYCWRYAPTLTLVSLGILAVLALLAMPLVVIFPTRASTSRLSEEISALQKDLRRDFFTNLVDINFKYIDKYYLQTQVQADRAFWLAAITAFLSFILVGAGVAMMYWDPEKVKPAYLSAGTGVLGEFTATVCFYLYGKTVARMQQYHQKLVLTQNVSLALKIAEGLPDGDKAKAHMQLIESLSKDVNVLLSRDGNDLAEYHGDGVQRRTTKRASLHRSPSE